jgi:hypothetical protein
VSVARLLGAGRPPESVAERIRAEDARRAALAAAPPTPPVTVQAVPPPDGALRAAAPVAAAPPVLNQDTLRGFVPQRYSKGGMVKHGSPTRVTCSNNKMVR